VTDRAAGWEALSLGRWGEALEHFDGLDDDADALEGIGIAQWWLDDADGTLAARERAYRLYRSAGDPVGAARVASALAWDSLLFGGRTAVARGWLSRAARLLEVQPACPEHAWLAVREAEVALYANEPEAALAAARRAIAVGTEIGHEDVQVVARSLEGLALVQEGDVGGGMRRLDESAVAATAGDVADLMWIGKVCCNLIAACERVGDVERATQWCAEVKAFAQRWELRTLFNTCRTQYAAVLLQQGTWSEAEAELTGALEAFARSRRAPLVEGTARLGELRRRQGRVEEARTLFAQAELHFVARLGQIALALDEGDAATALALAERLERATGPYPRLSRVDVLVVLAKAGLASGRPEVARRAVEELARLAETIGTGLARAAHAAAAGMLAAFDGELDDARRLLEDAADRFGESIAPYERAQTQLALARVLGRLSIPDRARGEAGHAYATFVELDARRDAADAAALLQSLSGSPKGPLTRRELEVVALVAAGRTNGEIAADLVVSEHTVHRHVANILRKLREPTRAAAAARATRDGLV
jgi:ATP/maltotriose-dependent transcriptional regulator MalT